VFHSDLDILFETESPSNFISNGAETADSWFMRRGSSILPVKGENVENHCSFVEQSSVLFLNKELN
jgi:hypothetical protein